MEIMSGFLREPHAQHETRRVYLTVRSLPTGHLAVESLLMLCSCQVMTVEETKFVARDGRKTDLSLDSLLSLIVPVELVFVICSCRQSTMLLSNSFKESSLWVISIQVLQR